MNVRLLLAAVIASALAFAIYQTYLLTRPVPVALPGPPPAASSPVEAAPSSAGVQPYEVQSAASHAAGADAPFDRDVARRITVEQVKARVDRGQKIVFVDTRADIPDVMIKGAAQVPESKLDSWAKGVSKSAFVVVYCTCADESTAAREVLALQRLGFRNAYALRDGLFGWQTYDLPTEPPPRPVREP